MKVSELIEHLKQFPPDADVIHTYCSDYEEFDADLVTLIEAESRRLVRRQGRVIEYRERQWPKDETPEFVTAVHFPGN